MSYQHKHDGKEYWVKESAKWGTEVHDLQTSPRNVVFKDASLSKLPVSTFPSIFKKEQSNA